MKNLASTSVHAKFQYPAPESNHCGLKQQSLDAFTSRLCVDSFVSTDSGKLIEHIYGFLIIVERILQKYDNRNPSGKSE
jgi:hypothetical protein